MPYPAPRGTDAEVTASLVEIEGKALRLTNLDKVLYPAVGFTKADLIDYYTSVAPVLLPHLAGHPVTLHRFPDGVHGVHFYETRCPPRPDWLPTQHMYTFRRSGKEVFACLLDGAPALVWAAQVAAIELHPYLGLASTLDCPTALVFDLDPGPPAGFAEACRVALDVRAVLDGMGLASFPKTSGWAGMHVYVPLNGTATYDDTRAFARAVAAALTQDRPDAVIDVMTRARRAGKVFVDWSQNDAGKSTVVAYSLRGREVPVVSAPVTWEEVAEGAEGRPLVFGPETVLRRVEDSGDLFAPVATLEQTLPGL